VTGGASGIARATALLFAKEGAKVVIADRQKDSRLDEETPDTAAAIQAMGGEALFVQTDVSKSAEVNAMVHAAVERFGKVNILVNCAGIFVRNEVTEVSDEEWAKVLGVNLSGYFYTARAVIPYMKKQGEGRIVNISSIHGIRGTSAALTYCATKGGIENMTKQLAMEYAPLNIRVNAVTPGTVRTAMCLPFLNTPNLRAEYEKRTLLPRLGVPEDIAYAALFLASHESGYVVGHSLVVDGGWTIT
jgi:NAD(P)-dependent dehydrogenase (short-subunit alcohol dehydrogenase family)